MLPGFQHLHNIPIPSVASVLRPPGNLLKVGNRIPNANLLNRVFILTRWGGLQIEISFERQFSTIFLHLNHTKWQTCSLIKEKLSWRHSSVVEPPYSTHKVLSSILHLQNYIFSLIWRYPKQSADALNSASFHPLFKTLLLVKSPITSWN